MKKALLLAIILMISVFTTACINNLAVQELNTKAKNYLENGDYTNAIERLKSSLDLDSSIFETHYNLAVAYTKNEDYQEAIEAYNNAIKLNPNSADVYYSLAVCEENLAKDILSGIVAIDENKNIKKLSSEEIEKNATENKELTKEYKEYAVNLLQEATEDYLIYIDKTPDKSSESEIQDKVKELEDLAAKHESVQK